MVQLALEGRDGDMLRDMAAFLRCVGLPARRADFGLADARDEDLRHIATASLPSGNIRNFPGPVDAEALCAAIRRVESLN
jgi:glycerol dehydrogenase-like iron-containing ADH family enzyme